MGLETIALVASIVSAVATIATTIVSLLAPDPDTDPGDPISEYRSGHIPYRYIMGRGRIRGLPVWTRDVDPADRKLDLHQVIALAEGSLTEVEKVFLGGKLGEQVLVV